MNDKIQVPRELLERLTIELKFAIKSLEFQRIQLKECDMDFNPIEYIDPVLTAKRADLRAVEALLNPMICAQCGNSDNVIKHADGKYVCHATHIVSPAPADTGAAKNVWHDITKVKPKESDANKAGELWFWVPRLAAYGAQRDIWDCGEDATHWMRCDDNMEQDQPNAPQVSPEENKAKCPQCGIIYTPMHANEKCPTCRGIS